MCVCVSRTSLNEIFIRACTVYSLCIFDGSHSQSCSFFCGCCCHFQVAVQLQGRERVVAEFSLDTTVWQVLRVLDTAHPTLGLTTTFEPQSPGGSVPGEGDGSANDAASGRKLAKVAERVFVLPVCRYVRTELATLEALRGTTLRDLGVAGKAMISVRHVKTSIPEDVVLAGDAESEKPLASSPSPASPPPPTAANAGSAGVEQTAPMDVDDIVVTQPTAGTDIPAAAESEAVSTSVSTARVVEQDAATAATAALAAQHASSIDNSSTESCSHCICVRSIGSRGAVRSGGSIKGCRYHGGGAEACGACGSDHSRQDQT